ncbi:MAG: 16S rRNA methyltransferase [Desulfurococcaceae archaeon]
MSRGALKIVLLEAPIELVPETIRGHPAIVKWAKRRRKKPSEILLDVSLHRRAMEDLPKRHKRGRPDIVHITLLLIMESYINRKNMLEIFVHTINNELIHINPTTRLPKNYNRFVGLMEQLLKVGRVPPTSSKPLLWVERGVGVGDVAQRIGTNGLLLLWERGERAKATDVVKLAMDENLAICIGAFPHGDFDEETLGAAERKYSLYEGSPLPAWVIASKIIFSAEELLGIT